MCRIEPPPGVSIIGCAWLDAEGRCRVYGERPIRCQAFGVVSDPSSDFHCPDCVPEQEITDEEMRAIINEYDLLTGAEVHTYTGLGQEVSRLYGDKDGQEEIGTTGS